MVPSIEYIQTLKERVLQGGEITFDEALILVRIEEPTLIEALLQAAHEITLHFNGNKAGLCALINAKSYLCGEDCAFCSQSVRYDTGTARYEFLDLDVIVQTAKRAEAAGAHNFCIVTSGASPNEDEFNRILEAVRRLKMETGMEIDLSVGFLSSEQAAELKEAGVRMVNDNVQTSRAFYPQIVTTHTYDKRLETLRHLREEGLQLCSGGILGMGETEEDRLEMAFELKAHQPECLPVNILNPRPGTPLEKAAPVSTEEILKTVAVYRFILPKSNIKIAGGREVNLGPKQELALKGGANGIIIGGYLTTAGNPVPADLAMLKRLGYDVDAQKKTNV